MSYKIAVAGKGGVGKSTFSALILRYLLKNKLTPVLAIDADADSNLADLLAIKDFETVGLIKEEMLDNVNNIPASMPKQTYVEIRLEDVLNEHKGFDLLVMGQGEGKGCYCYINNILRKYIDILQSNYKYMIMDNQAGLEHLNRHVTQNIDVLFLVSDPSIKGIDTAAKVNELVDSLKLNVSKRYLVVSRTLSDELPQALFNRIKEKGLELIGTIPSDPEVVDFDLEQKSVLDLGEESVAIKAVDLIMGQIINSK